MLFVTGHEGPKRFALPGQRTIYFCKEILIQISMFHRAFFNSIIDKHQHKHLTLNSILV